MKELLLLTVLSALGVLWLTRCINQAGNLILKRLDELEAKIDSRQA